MLLIKGAHVVDPQVGLDGVYDVLVEGERIARVGEQIRTPEGAEVIDAAGKYLVPGLTDIHVHFRDPGYEYKETIETGSAAAATGGFTDVATMPNTDPVVDSGEGIRYQIAKGDAAGLVHVRPSAPARAARRARRSPRSVTWSPRAPACSPTTATASRAPACCAP